MSDWDPQVLPPAAIEAIRDGRKIEAINIVREHTGLDLTEAKALVDAAAQSFPGGGVPRAAQGREDHGNLRLLALLILFGAAAAVWLLS